jgi:hypothetical protein
MVRAIGALGTSTMEIQSEELARRQALEADHVELLRGREGKTRVRPAARVGQPYDKLVLNFPAATINLAAPGAGTVVADSAPLLFDPHFSLSPYVLLLPDPLNLEVDDAALGGSFSSFLMLTFDDDSEFGLNAMQLLCQTTGECSVGGPLVNFVASIGASRKIKAARLRLQASGAGSAMASVSVGPVEMLLIRSKLSRTITYPAP